MAAGRPGPGLITAIATIMRGRGRRSSSIERPYDGYYARPRYYAAGRRRSMSSRRPTTTPRPRARPSTSRCGSTGGPDGKQNRRQGGTLPAAFPSGIVSRTGGSLRGRGPGRGRRPRRCRRRPDWSFSQSAVGAVPGLTSWTLSAKFGLERVDPVGSAERVGLEIGDPLLQGADARLLRRAEIGLHGTDIGAVAELLGQPDQGGDARAMIAERPVADRRRPAGADQRGGGVVVERDEVSTLPGRLSLALPLLPGTVQVIRRAGDTGAVAGASDLAGLLPGLSSSSPELPTPPPLLLAFPPALRALRCPLFPPLSPPLPFPPPLPPPCPRRSAAVAATIASAVAHPHSPTIASAVAASVPTPIVLDGEELRLGDVLEIPPGGGTAALWRRTVRKAATMGSVAAERIAWDLRNSASRRGRDGPCLTLLTSGPPRSFHGIMQKY